MSSVLAWVNIKEPYALMLSLKIMPNIFIVADNPQWETQKVTNEVAKEQALFQTELKQGLLFCLAECFTSLLPLRDFYFG